MARLLVAVLALAVAGCATVQPESQDAGQVQLSAKEVRRLVQGNTLTAAEGATFYWDASGAVAGKGAIGGVIRGSWHVTDDGRLCVSDWDTDKAPVGCYSILASNGTQEKRVMDMDGRLKFTIISVASGNSEKF